MSPASSAIPIGEGAKRFNDALHKLHKLMKRWDDFPPVKPRARLIFVAGADRGNCMMSADDFLEAYRTMYPPIVSQPGFITGDWSVTYPDVGVDGGGGSANVTRDVFPRQAMIAGWRPIV